jgi:hypothetical protein
METEVQASWGEWIQVTLGNTPEDLVPGLKQRRLVLGEWARPCHSPEEPVC